MQGPQRAMRPLKARGIQIYQSYQACRRSTRLAQIKLEILSQTSQILSVKNYESK